jgi:hypothetical protein
LIGLAKSINRLRVPPIRARFFPLSSLGYFLRLEKATKAKIAPRRLRNSSRGEYQLRSPRIPKTRLRTAARERLV